MMMNKNIDAERKVLGTYESKNIITGLKKLICVITAIFMLVCIVNNPVTAKAEGTPRLLIEGYDITGTSENGKVFAGNTFTITLHLKNASTKTALYNMLVNFSSEQGEFIPADGGASVYIEKIGTGETLDISMEMVARSDLEQKPYILNISADYEDRYNMPYQMTEKLSIPVNQEQRVIITDSSISSSVSNVGLSASISLTINNAGKTTLYNTRVVVDGNGIENQESYIGNVTAGQAGYADVVFRCKEVTNGPETITATVYYEDVDGNESSYENEFLLQIDPEKQVPVVENEKEKKTSSFGGIIPYVIIAAVVILVIVIAAGKKRKDDDIDEV